jgi:hypothetical protein
LQPGQFYYGTAAPLVKEETGVLVHNPQAYSVTLYQKAVRARRLNAPDIAPGKWVTVTLRPDHAMRVDCDDITRLLTGNPAATFIGTYGLGVEVEGFVVVAVGPQITTAGAAARFGPLDVTAEYARSSEVLKKDIDCRADLYNALRQDVARDVVSPTLANLTHAALEAGAALDPTSVMNVSPDSPPALVALIGRCDKLSLSAMSVDYLLVSNKGSTDPDPRAPSQTPAVARYPWLPGRWYDLTVVMPQNVSKDIDAYLRQWHVQRWIDAGATPTAAQAAMAYYLPYWCGWGYWWWWWNGSSCIDIGVGEGESLDVEQVAPARVYMPVWPPTAAGAAPEAEAAPEAGQP